MIDEIKINIDCVTSILLTIQFLMVCFAGALLIYSGRLLKKAKNNNEIFEREYKKVYHHKAT